MKLTVLASVVASCLLLAACDEPSRAPTSDQIQRQQQERILQEGTSDIGMPAIKNFREKRLVKDILEKRDQAGLVTYTYTFSEMTGKYAFFCNSIGYGLPYATQFTNPQKIEEKINWNQAAAYAILPQADPNGLFSPGAAEGTWIECTDPSGSGKTQPIYVEPRVIVSPFKLPER